MILVDELINAINKGDLEAVESMLEQDPDLVNAAEDGSKEMVELLIAHGANIEAVDERRQNTPLSWAAFYGRKDVAGVLLANGANVNHRNRHGVTPLSYALRGAKSDFRKQGATASAEEFLSVAELLRQHGAQE